MQNKFNLGALSDNFSSSESYSFEDKDGKDDFYINLSLFKSLETFFINFEIHFPNTSNSL